MEWDETDGSPFVISMKNLLGTMVSNRFQSVSLSGMYFLLRFFVNKDSITKAFLIVNLFGIDFIHILFETYQRYAPLYIISGDFFCWSTRLSNESIRFWVLKPSELWSAPRKKLRTLSFVAVQPVKMSFLPTMSGRQWISRKKKKITKIAWSQG